MVDLQNREYSPSLEEVGEYVKNPLFFKFCEEIKNTYRCTEKIEFSSCKWELGWNVKFKKAGKNLCTIYPRKGYFKVTVVVGKKEKEAVEKILPECSSGIRDMYWRTEMGNGQKWLTAELGEENEVYTDVLRFIKIRRG